VAKLEDMDVNALRFWGIVTSAALMAGALLVAAPWRTSARAEMAVGALEQITQDQPPADAPVSFLVRFRGDGPIARAQALAQRGREMEAGAMVAAQVARQRALRGLCFDRFTVGAAEVVLRSCAPIAAEERATVQARWLARLRDIRAVAYADLNATLAQEHAPG
jgi:hypothetical protein